MFIKNISMKNFGNVEEERLDFTKGLTLFSGNNGQGKSTVLKCLALLLFNQTSGKLSDYIRWGTENFLIGTEFSHLGQDFEVTFEYSEKLSKRIVKNLNTNEEFLNSSAISFLDEFLDFNRAKASIISFENEIDLVTTSPSERREYLKKIYDLNFKEELQKITMDSSEAKEKVSTLSGEIVSLESQSFDKMLLERLPMSEESFESLKENLALSEKNLFMQEKELLQIERTLKEQDELLKKKRKLENDIDSQTHKIGDLNEKLEEEKLNNETIVFDISDLEKAKKEKEKELNESLWQLQNENKELKEVLDETVLPDFDFEKEKENLKNLEQKIYGNKIEKKRLEEFSSVLESGVCPTCNQKIDVKLLEENEKELRELEVLLKERENEFFELETAITYQQKQYDDILRTIKRTEKELQDNEYDEKEYIKMLENTEKELQQRIKERELHFKHKKEMSDRDVKAVEDEIESLKKIIIMMETNLQENNTQIENLPDIVSSDSLEQEIKELKILIEENKNKIKIYEKVLISNEEKRKFNLLQTEKEEKRNSQVEKKKKEVEEYQEKIALYDVASKILSREFPSFVISKMVKSLSFYINEFLSKVYPQYEIEVVESRNSLRVLYGPEKSDVKLASGFEQQVFSFAWKYALGKIQNYGLLILDEVDSTASEENSEKFYLTLAKMEEYFEQIFIVTHKQDIKTLLTNDFSATVYEVEKGKYTKTA